MAKKFMFVCAGLFLLAGAFALGSISAGAQTGSGVRASDVGRFQLFQASYIYLNKLEPDNSFKTETLCLLDTASGEVRSYSEGVDKDGEMYTRWYLMGD